MFKKIEIWVLYLVMLLGILVTVGFGALVRQELEGNSRASEMDISFLSKPAIFIARLPAEFLKVLVVPNVNQVDNQLSSGKDFFKQDGFEGNPNSEEFYFLLSRYDGDLEESVVELIDLTNFEILHTWNPDIDAFNDLVEQDDEFKYLTRDSNNYRGSLLHPKFIKDGDLLFQGNRTPLIRIDACSDLIFQNQHDQFHHSLETDIEGNIWVPSHMYPQSLPAEKVGRTIVDEHGYVDDAIVKLSVGGDILFEKSVSEIFIDNGLEYLLFSVGDRLFEVDPIHLNDIQPVDFDGEFWQKGDVFLSLRHQSMVLLYRPSTNEIVWKGTGPFFHQHDVDILDEHRISIFNNNSKDFVGSDIVDGYNQVIIYDFRTNEYSNYLEDSLVKHDVKSVLEGRSEILPNGDLFIEETTYARTLYFHADGSLRWSYINRADNGNVYRVNWSRILYTEQDIQTVNNFLKNKGTCNE